jgi:DeoR/GlpR family transcriptional regulator of sugar metabolism
MTISSASRPATADKVRVQAAVRHAHILDALAKIGAVSVAEVAMRLGVSDMTIRRDLADLEREGRLLRTHGGAIRSEGPAEAPRLTPNFSEPSFESRLQKNAEAKQWIAAGAAALARGAKTIALDVGTTTFWLARHLAEWRGAKVFTNSLRIAGALAEGRCEVYVPGGRVRVDEMSICGATAVQQFEELWFDIAFVGVSGLTSDGLFDYSLEDAEMKRVYLRRATRRIVLCDSSKYNAMSLAHIAPLSHFHTLVSDAAPPAEIGEALLGAGVAVEIAGPGL